MVKVGFQVLNEKLARPIYRGSVDLCKKIEMTQKRIGSFHMIFWDFFFPSYRRAVTPRAFRNDAVTPITSRFPALFPMATCHLLPKAVTVAVVYGLRVCKGGCCNVHEQSNNNYSRLLCLSPLDFSFATCLLSGLKWEGIREFLTWGESDPYLLYELG